MQMAMPKMIQEVRLTVKPYPDAAERTPSARYSPGGVALSGEPPTIRLVIYCVIPAELEEELYERLDAYYRDNPDVTVIVDRRAGFDRRAVAGATASERRLRRDRRRSRAMGSFPRIDAPGAA